MSTTGQKPNFFSKKHRPPLGKKRGTCRKNKLCEIRMFFYLYKIIGAIWFDNDDIPIDLSTPFTYVVNMVWPNDIQLPKSLEGFNKLSESELNFIAKQLHRPSWIQSTNSGKATITMQEALNIAAFYIPLENHLKCNIPFEHL